MSESNTVNSGKAEGMFLQRKGSRPAVRPDQQCSQLQSLTYRFTCHGEQGRVIALWHDHIPFQPMPIRCLHA